MTFLMSDTRTLDTPKHFDYDYDYANTLSDFDYGKHVILLTGKNECVKVNVPVETGSLILQ